MFSIAIWLQPASASQSAIPSNSWVIVPKVRIPFWDEPPVPSETSNHELLVYFEATAGVRDFHRTPPKCGDHQWGACSLQICCVLPEAGAIDGEASKHPGQTVGRLEALESADLWRWQDPAPSIDIFI